MNWINNGTRLFSESNITNGINLRDEFHEMLYGSISKPPLGHWVVLRHFDKNEKSGYYNKYSNEGLNGPKYKYTDILLRTRRTPYPKRADEEVSKLGQIPINRYLYFFEHTVDISDVDQIYELNVSDHTNQPTSYEFTERYSINRVIPNRMEYGNVQYLSILSEMDTVGY